MKSAIQLTTAGSFLAGPLCSQPPAQPVAAPTSTPNKTKDPLLRLLAAKGLVGADEPREIAAADPAQMRVPLAQVLRKKGVQSEAELQEVFGSAPAAGWNNPSAAWVAPEPPVITAALPNSPAAPAPRAVPMAPAPAATPAPLAANKTAAVVPAVAPLRFGGSRNVKLLAETAVVLSAFGDTPSNVAGQLGYGERQGADSGRPEIQGRIVAEWQFDKAPGVVPAQIVTSFVPASRKALIKAADVPAAFKAAFPNGGEVSSGRYGYTVELQLPTRAATFTAKYFNGQDLRFYFVGGLYSNFNNAFGLTGQASAPSMAGQSALQHRHGSQPRCAPHAGCARQKRPGGLHPYAAHSSATDFGGLFLLRGIPSRQWHDIRTEIGPIFTF